MAVFLQVVGDQVVSLTASLNSSLLDFNDFLVVLSIRHGLIQRLDCRRVVVDPVCGNDSDFLCNAESDALQEEFSSERFNWLSYISLFSVTHRLVELHSTECCAGDGGNAARDLGHSLHDGVLRIIDFLPLALGEVAQLFPQIVHVEFKAPIVSEHGGALWRKSIQSVEFLKGSHSLAETYQNHNEEGCERDHCVWIRCTSLELLLLWKEDDG